MEIANPIYDAVFKFLMEDQKSAKILVSAITGFDIESLELRPTEVSTKSDMRRPITVYRLDLAAKIATNEGSKLIIIEIQKAKLHTDIIRFRRYLGGQYSSQNNYEESFSDRGLSYQRAIPIYSIYILGHSLEKNPDIPVIKVKRSYIDNSTNNVLLEKDEFIESLTHDSAIIQIPALANRRRDRLEKILSVFDQALIKSDTKHLLKVPDTDDYPEECKALLRRLLSAIADDEVRERMYLEDELFNEFKAYERQEELLAKKAEEALKREEEERKHKEEALKREEEALAREQKLLKELEALKKQLKT